MSTGPEASASEDTTARVPLVDPRAPRFGQAVTAIGLLIGLAFQIPALIYLVTATFVLAVGSRWRYDAVGLLFERFVASRLDPRDPEPAAPHRFAKLVGAAGTTAASGLLLAGYPGVAYAVAGLVAAAAGLGATTGICIGCQMYRSVSFFHRLDVI